MLIKIIIGILCAISFYIFYKLGKNSAVQERTAENTAIQKRNEEIEREYKERELKLKEITEKTVQLNVEYNKALVETQQAHNKLVNDLTINYKNLEADYALRAAEMSHNLDAVKDNRFSTINQAATKYREKLYNEIQQEIAEITNSFLEKQTELEEIKAGLLNDILELQSSRDALIEANKREEELRLQQEFYKINLKEQDFNDIKLLKSIEQYLYNKDALYKLIWTQFYMTPTKDTLNRIIGKEKTSGIYKITNQINGKVYIGQSVDVHSRITNHIKAAIGIGTIAHQLVHDAMAAHGIENFTFELVEKCDKNQLNKKEKLWIETYASDKYGYNRTAGGSKEE